MTVAVPVTVAVAAILVVGIAVAVTMASVAVISVCAKPTRGQIVKRSLARLRAKSRKPARGQSREKMSGHLEG